jgi:hypothetical protein
LDGLPLIEVQRVNLSGLRWEARQFGWDDTLLVRYQAWWNRLGELVRQIQSTPAIALSKAERDALVVARSVAEQETNIIQDRLGTRIGRLAEATP